VTIIIHCGVFCHFVLALYRKYLPKKMVKATLIIIVLMMNTFATSAQDSVAVYIRWTAGGVQTRLWLGKRGL